MQTQMIHTRINKDLKQDAETIFSSLGMTTTDAIRLFFSQVTLQQGMPFEVRIPNKETQEAIRDVKMNTNLRTLYSIDELKDVWNA